MKSRTPTERNARFALVSLPVVMAAGLILAIITLIVATRVGGTASGERVEMRFDSACAQELAPLIQSRVEQMGLGEPSVQVEGAQVVVVATLPGLEDDLQAVPALLSAGGEFAIYQTQELKGAPTGEPLATSADLLEAWYQLSFEGHPLVELELQPQAILRMQERRDPFLVYTIDGQVVERWLYKEGPEADEMDLQPELERAQDEVRLAADWTILLRSGPTPCPASLGSVQVIQP